VSTFSGLNTAYTGLAAARHGLDVVGQNLANAATAGYTRQRVDLSSVGPVAATGPIQGGVTPGQGVSVDGIQRLGDTFLDARVRTSAAASGYWTTRSGAMSELETSLNEPGANGVSAKLQAFWSGWHDLANNSSNPAVGGVLLQKAGTLTAQIAQGYQSASTQWAAARASTDQLVTQVNEEAAQVADLNGRIRSTMQAGGSVNELLDKRSTLATSLAKLVGGTLRDKGDGTAEILVGGNPLVSGDGARTLTAVGAPQLAGATSNPVHLEWTDLSGIPVALEGGNLAGAVSLLAAANGGAGGALAEAAQSYNDFATTLANQVNAIHSGGATPTGATGLAFFGFAAGVPAALGLQVVPTNSQQIASAVPGKGAYDGSVADQIAQLGVSAGSPDHAWSTIVTRIGVQSQSDGQQATLAGLASTNANTLQLSNASVDTDEENMNMITYQHTYQAAARVMSTIDSMLDTLINHTGVGA
jgi:flagellar hook-associated protein 1 FlgK